jgi:hydroxyacyl-ACP dehydratase HTD2-like protein with hotdog domain
MTTPVVALSGAPLPASLPELTVTPTHTQLFMFSAVTWNRHHIHYSKDAAMAEGLPDVVVQRALLGNFLARALTDWLGDAGELRELSWKVLSSATPGRTLRCQGEVTAREVGPATSSLRCDVRIVDDRGTTIATGRAMVVLDSLPA